MAVDRLIWKIVLDFVTLLLVGFPLLAILLWGKPYERGYFEFDMSIRLPFKQESISEGLLAGVGFGLIVVAIIITEVIRDKRGSGIGEKFINGALVPGWVWESYVTIGVFTFGAACQQLVSNTSKYVIGRLRPHFYDVCLPVPNQSDQNVLGYIQNYTCTGNSTSLILEARLSFPSAHSSFAMYTAIFFIFYIQVKGRWRGSKLLRHLAQFAALLGAWYVGLSRVVEHKHHWSDVAAGFLIGAMFAALVFIYVLKPKKYGLPGSWQDPTMQANPLPRPALAR
ncbi:putative phosphatidate phosphatase [Ostrinia nubilalis]|uniref:putative phosphatidate phosphatase n=1 Tax=Ostrinia nubilalis TaxID=29057 RepID=UPI0030823D49